MSSPPRWGAGAGEPCDLCRGLAHRRCRRRWLPRRRGACLDRDRRAFLDWFALIAEAQAYAIDPRWDPAQRDCAGLVRFAYRMALQTHDRAWLAKAPFLPGFAPDVERFHAPDVPLLGPLLFRVAPGSFDEARIAQDFSASASASHLAHESARPLAGDEAPERGDLLFFESPEGGVEHLMVNLGDGRVAYHTGPRDDGPGEVRLVPLASLFDHPDPRWRPITSNPAFKGYYRWRIVGAGSGP